AISGDLVIVKPLEEGRIRTIGRVIKIVKKKELFVGTYKNGKVYPDDISVGRAIKLKDKVNLEDNVKVLFKISRGGKLKAKIVETIGKIDEPDVDLKVVIKTYNLPLSFEKEVEQEVEFISDRVILTKNRLDLRGELIYTIDPIDAKDYDDAISVKKEGENYILGVHIADVSHYVKLNTNLDKSARERATSVYLLDFVIPMLPYKLSNYLASLQPAKDRYAFSVIMKIDKYGNILDTKFYKSVVNSKARLTYEDAQEILENRKPKYEFTKFADDSYIKEVSENLKLAKELSYILRERRERDGSLDFDLPEPYFVRNERGEIVDIIPKIRLDTHRIVEDFMILANMVVAEYFSKNNIPAIYRVHDRPDPKKIKNFIVIAKNVLNTEIPIPEKITSLEISKILKKVKNSENEDLLTYLLLRSMAKAKYSINNIGHFGLAIKHYTHFTSPIRRYADLVVHRILYSSIKNKVNRNSDYIEELDEIARHCSKMEEIAEDAEWDLWESKKLDFMKNKIGEVFEGIVSGFSNEGIYVEIKEHLVEGIVPEDNITIDENRYLAYINGKVFTLGQRVKIKVIKIIKEFKKMILSLLDI
ncbi:MAG: VacB/RNase II family 3'-5' exoribonuclease, partial [candidate division WOR-3 bacterium]|nr:VacB/RNase II family 3'-5' exoribonuclease [candidate division WOR-3 bacterium]MDW8150789.1 VacB/RNase II family 3'-5' exoribonuclease [candidate division WOR-3 bacterium]